MARSVGLAQRQRLVAAGAQLVDVARGLQAEGETDAAPAAGRLAREDVATGNCMREPPSRDPPAVG